MKDKKLDFFNKTVWNTLNKKEKIEYIWDYYKFPIFVVCILLYIAGSMIYGQLTNKEPLLYLAFVNVNPSQELTSQITDGYLEYSDSLSKEDGLQLYTGLYLTDDPQNPYVEYTYASRIKIIGAVDKEALDILFMNKEAFDAFSQSGYLCDLETLLNNTDIELYNTVTPYFAENIVILEDNSMEVSLDPSIPYESKTEVHSFGLDLSQKGLLASAGFDDTVYLGILANSPRTEACLEYISYLFSTVLP